MYTTYGTWGNLSIDSGREMYVPAVLAQGKMLYRDVFWIYSPLAPYVNAALFRLFGIRLEVILLGRLARRTWLSDFAFPRRQTILLPIVRVDGGCRAAAASVSRVALQLSVAVQLRVRLRMPDRVPVSLVCGASTVLQASWLDFRGRFVRCDRALVKARNWRRLLCGVVPCRRYVRDRPAFVESRTHFVRRRDPGARRVRARRPVDDLHCRSRLHHAGKHDELADALFHAYLRQDLVGENRIFTVSRSVWSGRRALAVFCWIHRAGLSDISNQTR